MDPSFTSTRRLLLNLQMRTYKKTLVTFFILELVITFAISMNGIQENEGVTPSFIGPSHSSTPFPSHPSLSNSTRSTPTNNQHFFAQSVKLSNPPLNIVGILLISFQSAYFTLLYLPLRYFYLYALIRNVFYEPIFSCPLTIDFLLVLVLHLFYIKLYDSTFRWGRTGDGDDAEELVLDDEESGSGIFSIENHLHSQSISARLNAPPPSYQEVTRNPFKYPTLVVEVPARSAAGASGPSEPSGPAGPSSSPVVRQHSTLETIEEEAVPESWLTEEPKVTVVRC